MKYFTKTITVFIFFSSSLTAQVSQKKILGLPNTYEHPYGPHERDLTGTSCKDVTRKQEQWIVYSDRAENQTYSDATLKQPLAKLGFMEKFFVVDDLCDKGIVQIIKYERAILKNGNAKLDIDNKTAKNMGFIKKDHLLLWRYSLEADTTNFTLKALPGHNLDAYLGKKNNSASYDRTKSELPLFDDPELKNQNEQTIRLFDFLYIYKIDKENGSYLIGRSDAFTTSSSSEIMGWAPKSYIINWKQRICLEPNSDLDAVNERKDAKIKACMLESEAIAKTFADSPLGVQSLMDRDPGAEGYNPYMKRFPILYASPDNNIVRTLAATDIFGSNKGEKIMSIVQQSKYTEQFNNAAKELRNFNIVFVVECTERLQSEQLQTLLNSLDNVNDEFGSENKDHEYQYKFGAVAYRTYEHSSCSKDVDLVATKQKLTTHLSEVQDFLATEIKRPSNCDSKAQNKALYTGLEKAMEIFNSPEETNIVILISTSGDMIKKAKGDSKAIVDAMVRYRASLIAFQYFNANGELYSRFVTQVKSLSQTTASAITKSLVPDFKESPAYIETDPNIYILDLATSAIPGSILLSSNNETMPPEKLREELINQIRTLQNGVENVIVRGSSMIEGVGRKDVKLDDLPLALLMQKAGININDPDVKQDFNTSNFQFFVPCYAVVKPKPLTKDLFRHVILISNFELNNLLNTLHKLTLGGSQSEVRKGLEDSFRQVMEDHFGEKEAKKFFKDKDMDEIFKMLTGLPSKSLLLKQLKIKDFTNESKLSDDKLQTIINRINDQADKLKTIANDPNNKYSFLSSGDKYFWIDEDDLP